MNLKKLLKDLPVKKIKGSKDIEIKGICSNSKIVFPGCLFIARKGKAFNGADFIETAISSGAVAIVTDMYNPFLDNVVQIICEDPNEMEAELAVRYYENSSEKLNIIGITGTNGKTTISYLIKHLFDSNNDSCSLTGTIETIVGDNKVFSSRTTSDVISIHKFLKESLMSKIKNVVMEVTSHGLDQDRVKYVDFDIGVFTNLSLDHLDYHNDMQSYALAKQKLFNSLKEGKTAIVNNDDEYASCMVKNTKANVITFAIDNKAELKATSIEYTSRATNFILEYENQKYQFSTNLIGKFNVYNILATIAVGLANHMKIDSIQRSIESFENVKGRMDRICFSNKNIVIDFAHTPNALQNVLTTLKDICEGRLITVFGCGGNRDKSKRPIMGEIAEKYSNFSIVTTDNIRDEDPKMIVNDIIAGFRSQKNYMIELDRKEAISKAILMASENDIILIAGKGHESVQIFANKQQHFNDKQVAESLLQEMNCKGC